MPKLNLGIRGVLCLFFIFLPLTSLDAWLYDQLFRLRGLRPRPSDILLVRVNDAKLAPHFPELAQADFRQEQQFSPRTHAVWYPAVYERLLQAILPQNPQLVALTPYFQWAAPGEAPHFSQERVLFASALNDLNQLVPPRSRLTTGDNYGFINLFPDRDNIVRQTQLVYSNGHSLALRMYHRLSDRPIKRNLLDPLRIDFRGRAGSYPSIEANDLLDGTVAPNTMKDRIVLVGEDSSARSEFETPFGRMSLLEIQANILETFLSGREIRVLPRWVTWILSAIAVGISITIILTFPLTVAWLLLLVFALALSLLTLLAFSQFKIWWGLGNPIFCIFATHLLMLGYRLSRQEEQQWRFEQEAETLREMDQFKNNFISLFSHDLKTPIAKIRAICTRLLQATNQKAEEIQDGLKTIDRSSTELARLISDILRVTKMESMSLEARHDVVDLNRLVELSIQRLAFAAEEKNIRLTADLEPLFSMEGDTDLLGEVIFNLLENAIKYSPAGSQVIVRTEENEQGVTLSVVDEGPGIPPDELPRVTGKFYRGRTTEKTTKGSGLGLYLAKYFVELHGGTLSLRSEGGRGTTVAFTLPLPK